MLNYVLLFNPENVKQIYFTEKQMKKTVFKKPPYSFGVIKKMFTNAN